MQGRYFNVFSERLLQTSRKNKRELVNFTSSRLHTKKRAKNAYMTFSVRSSRPKIYQSADLVLWIIGCAVFKYQHLLERNAANLGIKQQVGYGRARSALFPIDNSALVVQIEYARQLALADMIVHIKPTSLALARTIISAAR